MSWWEVSQRFFVGGGLYLVVTLDVDFNLWTQKNKVCQYEVLLLKCAALTTVLEVHPQEMRMAEFAR